jgi:hypothetical protein
VRRVVCDTGPLVHLFEADLLAILEDAGRVLVPPAVASELEGVTSGPSVRDLPWVEVRSLRELYAAEARPGTAPGFFTQAKQQGKTRPRQQSLLQGALSLLIVQFP